MIMPVVFPLPIGPAMMRPKAFDLANSATVGGAS